MNEVGDTELRTVADDLEHLDRDWQQGDAGDADIRRATGALAVLLIDGWYGRAWRAMGHHGEPSVAAVDYLATLQGQDRDAVEYAQAGGGLSHGVVVGGFREIGRAPTADEVAAMYKAAMAALEPRVYRLTEYLDAPSVVAKGRQIPRRLIVKYVRNRLGGGGHLGLTKDKDREFFDALDEAMSGREVAGRPAVYFEVLTIGQAIGQSGDARELCEAIRAKL